MTNEEHTKISAMLNSNCTYSQILVTIAFICGVVIGAGATLAMMTWG